MSGTGVRAGAEVGLPMTKLTLPYEITKVLSLLAEPEPAAVAPVAVPEKVRQWCEWWAGKLAGNEPVNICTHSAVAEFLLSLPTAPQAVAPEVGELERLRAELSENEKDRRGCYDDLAAAQDERDKLRSENEALRKERDAAIGDSGNHQLMRDAALHHQKRADELDAECDRLRATVRTLACEFAREARDV